MLESDHLELNLEEKKPTPHKPALPKKIRLPLEALFWIFFLTGAVFYIPLLCLSLVILIGDSIFCCIPSIFDFLFPTFCFGVAIYFDQLLKGWEKQECFPGIGYGFPAAFLVWIIGGTVSVLHNWLFAWLYNTLQESCILTLLIPTFSILIAVVLGFKAGKDGRTATFVQKAFAFLTRFRIALFTVIVLLIAASIVGQQIYYRTATQLQFLTPRLIHPYFNPQIFWNYFVYSDTSKCPFDKFQKLEYICVNSSVKFNSIPANPSIKRLLFLGNKNLTQADMKRLAQFPSLEYLELYLWKDSLKDSNSTGLEYLSQIKGLKYLTLEITPQTDENIHYLKDIPNLETLRFYMFFYDSPIDYASLLSAPKLKTLILAFPDGVDEAEAQRAREALPNCKIEVEKRASSVGR